MNLPRLRLSTVLILINLVILALPLGGIVWLRIYESALVRQTESELIAQGVLIAAVYQSTLARLAKPRRAPLGEYGVPATAPPSRVDEEGRWRPRLAVLDLATDPVHPRPPEPEPAAAPADALALDVGRELTPILREAQTVMLAGVRVVDYRGVVVASTFDGDYGYSLLNLDEVQRALAGESVSALRWRQSETPPPPLDSISRGTRVRVFVATPILRQGRVLGAVLLIRTPANIKQAIYGKRASLLKGAAALVVLALLLSLLSSATIGRPVRALIEQARRAARGEKNAVAPLARPGTREIAELSETVAAMARTLEDRADYIRNFAAHVSHEFKTPLTAIQGAVEILREHADTLSPDERARFLDILANDARRLENLVRRLLELARADVMRVGADSADLAAVAAAAAARYRERGLRVDCAVPAGVQVAMAAETLDAVFGNLLDNSRQHAGSAAQVQISAQAEPHPPGQIRVRVADDGPGISEANAARIFEPFFTTARKAGNTGLGLAIIRALLHAHRGEIRWIPAPRGAVFDISLPLRNA